MLTELFIIAKYGILCNVNLIVSYMLNRYDSEFILVKRKKIAKRRKKTLLDFRKCEVYIRTHFDTS